MPLARGYVLTLAPLPRGGEIPLARAVEVSAQPGPPGLVIEAASDEAWRDAAAVAWRAARRLAPAAADARVVLRAEGTRPLAGGSSAHAIGLLVLSALSDMPLPPHFAIGHMPREDGALDGGAAAEAKARAAADVALTRGWRDVPFLYPPRAEEATTPEVLMPRRVANLGASFALLAAARSVAE